MPHRATIIFARQGVQGPVYVVTSLTDTPWEATEMQRTAFGEPEDNPIFSMTFDNVDPGVYQYKIRIGDNEWIVDDAQPIVTDTMGNQNNTVRTEPMAMPIIDGTEKEDDTNVSEDPAQEESDDEAPLFPHEAMGSDEPAPLMSHEQSGPIVPAPADNPNFIATVSEETEDDLEGSASSEVAAANPLGSNAAVDELSNPFRDPYVSGLSGTTLTSDTVDYRGSGNDEDGNDELNRAPSFSYERESPPASDDGPDSEHDEEGQDELSRAPTFPHENGSAPVSDEGVDSDNAEDEFDELNRAPTFFYKSRPVPAYDDGVISDEYEDGYDELTRAPSFSYEGVPDQGAETAAPASNGHLGPQNQFKTGNAAYAAPVRGPPPYHDVFGAGSSSLQFSRSPGRFTRSSSLPDSLPKSDAEDPNLRDADLEDFPSNMSGILDRVSTIAEHLPVDETTHLLFESHSPGMSVVSQAVSSTDLAPVRSYISLSAIAEDIDHEDDEENVGSGLPSPAFPLRISARRGPADGANAGDLSEDTFVTPMPAGRQRGDAVQGTSFERNDGVMDDREPVPPLQNRIATPSNVMSASGAGGSSSGSGSGSGSGLATPRRIPEHVREMGKDQLQQRLQHYQELETVYKSQQAGAKHRENDLMADVHRKHANNEDWDGPLPRPVNPTMAMASMPDDDDESPPPSTGVATNDSGHSSIQEAPRGFFKTFLAAFCSCFRPTAGGAALVVGVAAAAYYYLYVYAAR